MAEVTTVTLCLMFSCSVRCLTRACQRWERAGTCVFEANAGQASTEEAYREEKDADQPGDYDLV